MEADAYIERVELYTDGGCRPALRGQTVGAYLCVHEGTEIHGPISFSGGRGTVVTAELKAILTGMDHAIGHTRRELVVHSDNEFVVDLINGDKRTTKRDLIEMVEKIFLKRMFFTRGVNFIAVRRTNTFIQRCDAACNDRFRQLGITQPIAA